MNSYDKLLLALNRKLESLETKKASEEEKIEGIERKLGAEEEKKDKISLELYEIDRSLNIANNNIALREKRAKNVNKGAIIIFLLFLIVLGVSTAFQSIPCLICAGLISILGFSQLYLFNSLLEHIKNLKKDRESLLEEKDELEGDLAKVRDEIAKIANALDKTQKDRDKLNEIIGSLTVRINYVIESRNAVISKIAQEEEPRINSEFLKDKTLTRTKETMASDNDEY